MLVREKSTHTSWSEHLHKSARSLCDAFHTLAWVFQWMAYFLRRWTLLGVLEYLGSLSVQVAVIFYYTESGDHRKQQRYQAWQVINTAEDKKGSGGRIEALTGRNGYHLTAADLSDAALRNANLSGVRWRKRKAVTSVNIYDVRNAPPGFIDWAMSHGAKSDPAEE